MGNKSFYMMGMPTKRAESILYTDKLIIERNVVFPQSTIPLHAHSFYEFEIVIAGVIKSYINGKSVECTKGDFWLSLPNDVHYLRGLSDKTVLLSVKFVDELLLPSMRNYFNILQESIFGTLPESDFTNCRDFFRITIENYNKLNSEFNKQIYAKSALEMMLSYFMNYCVGFSEEKYKKILGNNKMFDAVEYIKKNFRNPITVNDMSKHFNYSPDYFSRKFKNVIGQSVIDFINNERLRYAYYLLTNSEMSVSEIADYVGFDSLSYFSRLFKRTYGTAPSKVCNINNSGEIIKRKDP